MNFMANFLGEPLKAFLQEVADVVVVAFFIIFFIAQSFIVDGHSMVPTLQHKERLIAEKIFYYFAGPRRGDIVVIKDPVDHNRYWVKRIIGIAGDTIEIRNGVVYLNGSKLPENYVAEPIRIPQEKTYEV
jgi:signal peptidase I